jgi:hypothetical protein
MGEVKAKKDTSPIVGRPPAIADISPVPGEDAGGREPYPRGASRASSMAAATVSIEPMPSTSTSFFWLS